MSKDFVQFNVGEIPAPYGEYIRKRNGLISRRIAEYLEIPFFGEVRALKPEGYSVPARTLLKSQARTAGIENRDQFYGAVIEDHGHVSKAVLHPTLNGKTEAPHFHSDLFVERVKDCVLPGFTVFSKEDAANAYENLVDQGYRVRAKKTRESDGMGQLDIRYRSNLLAFLKGSISDEEINQEGLVLEAQVHDPQTISIGYAIYGKDVFTFLAEQKNDKGEDGRDRYAGARVKVIKDTNLSFSTPNHLILNDNERRALEMAHKFHNAFSYFNPLLSRISFDCVLGADHKGSPLAGITDITARLGGTCPALILAAQEFKKNPDVFCVNADVTLNYQQGEREPLSRNEVPFIDHPSLRLTGEVTRLQRYSEMY